MRWGTEDGGDGPAQGAPTRPAPGALELQRATGDGWTGPHDRATLRAGIYSGKLTGQERVRAPGAGEGSPLREAAWAASLCALLERDRRGVRHVVSPAPAAAPASPAAPPATAPALTAGGGVGPEASVDPSAEAPPAPASAPAPVPPPVIVPAAPQDRSRLVMIGVGTAAVCAILLVVAWVALQT